MTYHEDLTDSQKGGGSARFLEVRLVSDAHGDENQPRPADVDFAIGMLNEGRTFDEVRTRLVERGLSQAGAEAVVHDLLMRAAYVDAVERLNQGASPEQVKQQLVDKGLEAQTAAAIVDDILSRSENKSDPGKAILLKGLGGVVFAIGAVLFIGNVTRLLPTFPLAGYLTMLIGGAIFGAGQKAG
jgi:hypothetical protein